MTTICGIWKARRALLADGPRRVLVVDDNPDAAESLALLFELSGFDSRYVLGGALAFDLIVDWVPDAVILDLSMPELDGFETARLLRAHDSVRDAVIVAFTALSGESVQVALRHAGFDGYCQKGGNPGALVGLIAAFYT